MPYFEPTTIEEKLTDIKNRLDIPIIVVICGSMRYMAEMAEVELREEAEGNIVLRPRCNMKETHELWANPSDAAALKGRLGSLHQAKIRLADVVLVVGDHIGDSTRSEIEYAKSLGKPVRFAHQEAALDQSAREGA